MATVDHRAAIERSIRLILETAPGERPMRPTFGAGLRTMIYEPMNATTLAQIRQRVELALVEWEPRITLEKVAVTPVRNGRTGELQIEIGYWVVSTNTAHNMVYPFYLIEGRR